jgi:hypothetical protein
MRKKNQKYVPPYVILFVQMGATLERINNRQYLQHTLFRHLNAEMQIHHLKRLMDLIRIRGPKYKPSSGSPALDIRKTVRIIKMKAEFKKALTAIHHKASETLKIEAPIPKFTDISVSDLMQALWTDKYDLELSAHLDQDVGLIPVLHQFIEKQSQVLTVPYITLYPIPHTPSQSI